MEEKGRKLYTPDEIGELEERIESLERQHAEEILIQKKVLAELKRLREEIGNTKGEPVAQQNLESDVDSIMKYIDSAKSAPAAATPELTEAKPVPAVATPELTEATPAPAAAKPVPTATVAKPVSAITTPASAVAKPKQVQINSGNPERKPVPRNAVNKPCATVAQKSNKKETNLENKFGKNLMGIIASVLIIVSLITFGGLIYRYLTDVVKVTIMYVISIALTAVGTYMIVNKKKSKLVFSAVAACGTIGIYITSLIGCLGFSLYSKAVLLVIIVLWLICVCIASRVASKMFIVIFNIGLVISVFLDASKSTSYMWDIIGYFVGISVIYILHKSGEYKKDMPFLLQIPFVTICFYSFNACNIQTKVIMCIFNLAVIFVSNFLYDLEYLSDAEGKLSKSLWYMATLFAYGVGALFAYNTCNDYLKFAFFVVSVVIALIYYNKYSKRDSLTFILMFYLAVAATLIFYNVGLISSYVGFIVPAVVLLAIGIKLKNKVIKYTGYGFLFVYTLLTPTKLQIWLSVVLIIIIAALLAFYLLKEYSLLDKMLLSILILFNVFKLSKMDSDISMHIAFPIFVILLCAPIYSKNWETREKELPPGILSKVLSLIFLLYCSIRMFVLEGTFLDYFISVKYITPLYVLFGVFLAVNLLIALIYRENHMRYFELFTSVLLMILSCTGDKYDVFGILAGIVILAAMTVRLFSDYHKMEKCVIASEYMLMMLCLRNVFVPKVEIEWVFIVISVLVILYNLPVFYRDFITKEEEKESKSFGYIINYIVMFILTILVLRSDYSGRNDRGIMPFVLMLSMIALYVLNVKNEYVKAMAKNEARKDTGNSLLIFICLKLSLMILVVLWSFESASYVISICGLIFAVICIAVGFKLKTKPFRIYGLILSLLCVVKIVLFDIDYSSSIMLPLGLFISGILCFVISWGYAKLEKQNTEEMNAEQTAAEEK